MLYHDYFAEAVDIPVEGYSRGDLVPAVEHLLANSPATNEDNEVRTPKNVQANNTLSYLVQCGWLAERQVGLRRIVEMKPLVRQFLEQLMDFAERGPQYLGGQAQVIYQTLKEVKKNPADAAPSFNTAAKQAKDLVRSVADLRTLVDDFTDQLKSYDNPRDYIETFFNYVSNVYIADYKDLRTKNHPLRHRHEILDIVNSLQYDPESRAKLLAYYKAHSWKPYTPEQQLERDIDSYLLFERIENHLDRLNEVIRRANHQALSYIDYELRARADIDRLIDNAIELLSEQPEGTTIPSALPTGDMFYRARVPTSNQRKAPPKRSPIRKSQLTPRQIALRRLHIAMRERRDISMQAVATHLDAALGEAKSLSNADLGIEGVRDLCTVLALTRIAAATTHGGTKKQWQVPGFTISLEGDDRVENAYFDAPRVTIQRTGNRL